MGAPSAAPQSQGWARSPLGIKIPSWAAQHILHSTISSVQLMARRRRRRRKGREGSGQNELPQLPHPHPEGPKKKKDLKAKQNHQLLPASRGHSQATAARHPLSPSQGKGWSGDQALPQNAASHQE